MNLYSQGIKKGVIIRKCSFVELQTYLMLTICISTFSILKSQLFAMMIQRELFATCTNCCCYW